jgi:hypothetical protein
VKLLWTAGWDSTYRLLDLLIVQARTVQPYYFELERPSSAIERERMDEIRQLLAREWPEARKRLLDSIFVDMSGVPANAEAQEALRRLRALSESRRLGSQYYDLAAAAAHYQLDDLELGIHVEEGSRWYEALRINLEGDGGVCRLVARPDPPELELFRRFAFPLIDLSKAEIARRAKKAGFADLLEATWFCHRPDRKGRPCGLCAPCRITMAQGLSRRIPLVNRLRHRLAWPVIVLLTRVRVRRRGRAALAHARSLLQRRSPAA